MRLRLRRAGSGGASDAARGDGAAGPPVTLDSPLLAVRPIRAAQLEHFLLAHEHGNYDEDEIARIARYYEQTPRAAGLDPLIVFAQMVSETAHLMSEWSNPPHRNPARIGVTDKTGSRPVVP